MYVDNKPFAILNLADSRQELITIAKVKPQSLDELSKIKGFGGQKISKFGDDIIALLNSI